MKKIISLLLVLMLIIISSMTAFADNPTTIDELIEKLRVFLILNLINFLLRLL